jgi:hypothetical protein
MSHSPRLFALEALVAGRLSPEGTARLERHLAACETCREALKAVRSYEALRVEARDHEAPDLAWEKLEQAIARDAAPITDGAFSVRTRPQPRNGRWVALAWPVLAIAATLVVAWISMQGQPQEAPRAEAPAQAVVPQRAESTLLEGRATLIEGRVDRVRDGARTALVAGEVLRERDRLITAEDATVHVALADGSGFALAAHGELELRALRTNGAKLELVRGELASQVRTLGASERFIVLGTTFEAHVHGTRFMVRQTADFAVAVAEGRVEIRRGDTSVAFVDAGQHWESSPGAAIALDRELGVYGLGITTDWSALTLPPHPSVAAWQLGPAWVPAGGVIAMRAPRGDFALALEDVNGKLHQVTVTVLPEGARLGTGTIDRLLAPRGSVGVLEASQISPVVHAGMGNLQRCYERALRTDPTLRGKLVLSLRVGADGRVGKAELAQNDLPKEAQRCVTDEARKWQFPRPEGGAVVFEVPLQLRARD